MLPLQAGRGRLLHQVKPKKIATRQTKKGHRVENNKAKCSFLKPEDATEKSVAFGAQRNVLFKSINGPYEAILYRLCTFNSRDEGFHVYN